jgi:DNA-binding NarL/FixJ family response regulator
MVLNGKVRILIADDHPMMREALRNILTRQDGFTIVGEASNGNEAAEMADKLQPNIVVMDISMPGLNGLEATRQIKSSHPEIAILILTVHDDSEHILGLLEAGAEGYLTKDAFEAEIVQAIRAVLAGDAVYSPKVSKQILRHAFQYKTKPLQIGNVEKFTGREMEILKMVANGLANKDIARKMDLSEYTIKGYLVNIFSKLKVKSRTEAIITCLRAGIISLDDLS